jgi:hypothetical protein
MREPFLMRYDEIAEMTWPQAIFLLNQGKFPNPRRRVFSSPEEAEAYLAQSRANAGG